MHDGASNCNGSNPALASRAKADDQLTLFVAEPGAFPERQYRQLTDGGPPFQGFFWGRWPANARPSKRNAGFRSIARRTGIVCWWSPTILPFHEMRKMEKHPGEFVGVMTGEAYTLLTAHVLQESSG